MIKWKKKRRLKPKLKNNCIFNSIETFILEKSGGFFLVLNLFLIFKIGYIYFIFIAHNGTIYRLNKSVFLIYTPHANHF